MFGRRKHLQDLRATLKGDLASYVSQRERAQAALVHARLAVFYNEGLLQRMDEAAARVQEELDRLEDQGVISEVPEVRG